MTMMILGGTAEPATACETSPSRQCDDHMSVERCRVRPDSRIRASIRLGCSAYWLNETRTPRYLCTESSPPGSTHQKNVTVDTGSQRSQRISMITVCMRGQYFRAVRSQKTAPEYFAHSASQ